MELEIKKSKRVIEYDGIQFDSDGEVFCYHFLTELLKAGYVNNFIYQPESFILSDKIQYPYTQTRKLKTKEVVTEKQTTLLNAHEYTADFKIFWNDKAKDIFFGYITEKKKLDNIPFIANYPKTSIIDVKPSFDFKGKTEKFIINSKWVYQKFGIYVQKITPVDSKKKCLFSETFVPEKCLYTAKTKKKKMYKFQVRTLKEYVESRKHV